LSDSSKNIVEFTLVYNQHKQRLYNFTLKMVNDKMLCEDIVQNVFIKLFENLEKIHHAESITFWLFTTARNDIYTHYRNKKIHVDQYGVADADEIDIDSTVKLEEEIELNETKEIIAKTLDGVPVDQREVFLLKEYGGFSYKEIASMLNIGEDLVRSRLFKTRKKLINRISKLFSY
jgi:RNA polymerase sigma factor (sigma-70 family)